MKETIKFIFLTLIIMVIVGWLSMSFYRAYKPQKEILQGQIEAREYNVSSKIAGRIDQIFVQKGSKVKKGDLIYTIHSPELEAKIEQARAGYEAAKEISKESKKGAREQTIISAKDMWLSAKAMRDLSEKTYNRVNSLYKNGVVSLQKRDEAYTAYQGSKFKENTAYQQYKLALEGASKETQKALEQKERAAAGTVSEVESYAKDAQVLAPTDGEISNMLLHSGELSPSGFPVVLLIDINDAYLKFHITEDKLMDFKEGSVFNAYIPSIKKNAQFKVTYISVMGEFTTWRSTGTDRGYDMRTYEVNASPVEKIEDLRVGMSVLIK